MIENYDHVILIKNFENFKTKDICWNDFKTTTVETFKTYFGKRLIDIQYHDKSDHVEYYMIGLILNPEMLKVTNEIGPVYGTEEAIKFKSVWGDMSKIMHIHGGVHESVVWPEKGNLTLKIVNFIMKEKLGFPPHGLKGGWHQIYSDQFNKFLKRFQILNCVKKEMATINEAYDVLSNTLSISTTSENFKKLPVHINELRPIGSWSKYTNVFPERCISIDGFNRSVVIDQINNVYHVALVVEANNKWPSDIDALKLMKTLFICKLSKLLSKDKRITSKVLKTGQLDVFIKGFVFRCFLVIKKELLVLKRLHYEDFHEVGKRQKRKAKTPLDGNGPLCNLPKSVRDFMLTHELIMNINIHIRCFSTQFGQAYIDTCRLAKRWLASQCIELIDDNDERIIDSYLLNDDSTHHKLTGWCFTDVAVELIVASLFIHPSKEYIKASQSGLCGFIRFLKLMFQHNWEKKPLVININNEFSDERFSEMSKPFSECENRHSQLPMLVIRTPRNTHGDHWTSVGPNQQMLKTVAELAKQAYFSTVHLLVSELDLKPIFTIDTSRFDVLFHLKSSIFNLVMDLAVDVKKTEINQMLQSKSQKADDRKYQMWPKDYDDNPIDNLMNWIRSFTQNSAICAIDKFGGRFIALRWLQLDVDKQFVIKTICNKSRNLISKCEILE